jgi:hypothetical protein
MTFIYNKLCNKQDELFFRKSYLQKGQGFSNEFLKTYKPFYLMKSCLFYNNILIFYLIL